MSTIYHNIMFKKNVQPDRLNVKPVAVAELEDLLLFSASSHRSFTIW